MKNFTSRENRTINFEKPVRVYRNLHNGKWSIKQGTLVIGYADELTLTGVKFTVSETGRQKVLREKKKYVHAYAVGYIAEDVQNVPTNEITYNPYKTNTFYEKATGTPVLKAEAVTLSNGKMYN